MRLFCWIRFSKSCILIPPLSYMSVRNTWRRYCDGHHLSDDHRTLPRPRPTPIATAYTSQWPRSALFPPTPPYSTATTSASHAPSPPHLSPLPPLVSSNRPSPLYLLTSTSTLNIFKTLSILLQQTLLPYFDHSLPSTP